MRVFKMNDCDWVCANSLDEAIKYYKNDFLDDFDDVEKLQIKECDIETDTMWYGFDIHNDRESTLSLSKFLENNKDKPYIIKYDKRGDFDCIIKLTFKEVIEFEKSNETYIICSTEY